MKDSEFLESDFIHLNQVTKNYKDPASNIKFQALRGIDLTISQGSITAIIGPSGAGKSTLLNILGGMTFPSTGSVTVDNMLLNDLDDHGLDTYRRNVVGFLWQLPERNLLPNLTALENITFSMEVSGYPRQERITRAKELLKSVGLGNRMNHKLGQLSGGEAQRASLSVALANKPKVLLADEPTGELDSETTMEIIDYLKQLNADLGLTIVVVTHDNRFERLTHQSYNILDGSIAGLRRSRSKLDSTDWRTAEREEVAVVDQFGKVRIPSHLRQKYHFGRYIRFIEDTESGRVYIEGVEHEL